METQFTYVLEAEDADRYITLKPFPQPVTGSNAFVSGVFSLFEGGKNLGQIVFDDKMNQWEYTALGNLSHREAGQIAAFIKNHCNSEK